MDYAPARAATASLIGDQNWGTIQNLPGNRRRLYAHALDLINTSYNTGYMAYWVSHYASFAPGQDYSGFLTYIQQRTAAVLSEISGAGGNSPFAITTTNLTTGNNLVTLSGTAPVQVQSIQINGVEYPLTWTSVSAWTVTVPVSSPTNLFNVAGFDLYGNAVTNYAGTVTVRYTGLAPSPLGAVVLNEIMYNPAIPDAAYVELFNASATASFDLSNWRVNGLGYTFPPGSIITNRQFLVLAKNRSAFISAYGTGAIAFDEFSGSLQTDGETLTLLMPGTGSSQEMTVDKVRYAAAAPWPQTDPGVSLQLIGPVETVQAEWHAYVRRLKAALAGSDLEFFKKAKGRTAGDGNR
jgi:hypothetical protein